MGGIGKWKGQDLGTHISIFFKNVKYGNTKFKILRKSQGLDFPKSSA